MRDARAGVLPLVRTAEGSRNNGVVARGYELVEVAAGRWAVDLRDDAEVAHALPMAPDALEPELASGLWLILAFAVWSGPDHAAIPIAVAVGRTDGVRVGVRPFDAFSEFATWCPDAPTGTRSPVWLAFRDGQLIRSAVGSLAESQVRALLES